MIEDIPALCSSILQQNSPSSASKRTYTAPFCSLPKRIRNKKKDKLTEPRFVDDCSCSRNCFYFQQVQSMKICASITMWNI